MRILIVLGFLAAILAGPRSAAAQAPSRPAVVCHKVGHLAISQNVGWTDRAPTAFSAVTVRALAATDQVSWVTIVNTHATQHLYLLLRASAAEATTAAIEIRAGASFTLDLWGLGVATIATNASGAATTGRITICTAVP